MPEAQQGLVKVDQILNDRFAGVKLNKSRGLKTIGYFCSYVPLEILTAVDLASFRITGDINEPVAAVDKILPSSFCPYIRNCVDLVFKGKYDFLDGVVGAHSCDAQEKSIHVWKSRKPYDFYHYLDMPATTHSWAERCSGGVWTSSRPSARSTRARRYRPVCSRNRLTGTTANAAWFGIFTI